MRIRKVKVQGPLPVLTMGQISKRLTTAMNALDEVAGALEDRGFFDARTEVDEASLMLNAVALRFCDDLEQLSNIVYDDRVAPARCPVLIPDTPKKAKAIPA